MTTTSAYFVSDTSYTNRVPYLTANEFNQSPNGMDTSNLVPGNAQANAAALVETIGRASSWIDQYTMGSYGCLAATRNQENARVWGKRDGTLVVHTRYWPILEIDSFSFSTLGTGFTTTSAASITPAGNIWIEPQQFVVQPNNIAGVGWIAPGGVSGGTQYYCVWSYTNGYPVSTLSASIAANATSITPVSIIGIYPGTSLTLYDLPNDEMIQVASTYVPGAATVPLVAGTQYSHAVGVMVTNLPPAVKQAAILLTNALIKQRGSGALEVADMGAITHQSSGLLQSEGDDVGVAMELIHPFKQLYLGT